MNRDWLEISKIPPSWQTRKFSAELLALCRKEKLIPKMPLYIEILGASQAQIKQLNFKFRGIKKPTDILSFEPRHKTNRTLVLGKYMSLGSLVICLPIVKSQARAQKHTIQTEFLVLLVHGLLHLLGFDHEKSPRKAEKMKKQEQMIIRKLAQKLKLSINEGLIIRTLKRK